MAILEKRFTRLGFLYIENQFYLNKHAVRIYSDKEEQIKLFDSENARQDYLAKLFPLLKEQEILLYSIPHTAVWFNPYPLISVTKETGRKITLEFEQNQKKALFFTSDIHFEEAYKEITEALLSAAPGDLTNYAMKADIPTNTSELINDSGYITKEVDDLVNYPTIEQVSQEIQDLDQAIIEVEQEAIDLIDTKQNKAIQVTITKSRNDWDVNNQTIVNIPEMKANDLIFVAPAPNGTNMNTYATSEIYGKIQADGILTLACAEVPDTVTINIGVLSQ